MVAPDDLLHPHPGELGEVALRPELVLVAAEAATSKAGEPAVVIEVGDLLAITDHFVISSGSNDRQVRAIVDEIEERLRKAGARPARREGEREARWVLLDYIDVVIHVQHAEERVYYSLERLWKDCPVIPLPEPVGAAGNARPGGGGPAGQA